MRRRLTAAILSLIAFQPQGSSAQDVEMLGRRYGTRPPDAYYRELQRNPNAFRFARGRAARMREAAQLRAARRALSLGGAQSGAAQVGPLGVGPGGPAGVGLGPRSEAVVGDVHVPVVLGLFNDSPPAPPVSAAEIQAGYFGPQAGTVADFYAEVSNDSITLIGDVRDWVTSSLTQAQATYVGSEGRSDGGLGCCGIGDYIKSLLVQLPGIDWGAFDNDGPDGIPNSGDDDGYVDALAVVHPTPGAECNQNLGRIWSHKWTLSDASSDGSPYVTSTPRVGGAGSILIEDYFVQPAVSCSGAGLNEIGVFTHELGHAFGLPDLYDTRAFGLAHDGAGSWDLMATGTWGCSSSSPDSPCHMGAWSKAMLGWVRVDTLSADVDHGTLTLPPVETSGLVYRVDAGDGSGEYFLLENRQSDVGAAYDQDLPAEGLLVWQVDQSRVDATWASNFVNASNQMGVWLRQADGLDELGVPGGDRGDDGDPFPGSTGNTAFHAASSPASTSHQGTPTGLTLVDIGEAGNEIDLRVLTRFTSIGLSSSGTLAGSSPFTVNGVGVSPPPDNSVTAAPFVPLTIEAAAGDSLAPGERTSFGAWADDPTETRTRLVVTPLADTAFSASYGGTEYQLRVEMTGGVNGVDPGILTSTPPSSDLWFPPGTAVTVTATPQNGFGFLGWTGDLAGQANPASVTLDAPVFGGADFQLLYSVPDTTVDLVAAAPANLQLAVEHGTAPISWYVESGTGPLGVTIGVDGTITGAPLDLGTFPLVIRATDALGLSATAAVTLDVAAPAIPVARLADPFLLGTEPPDSLESAFLDRQGNRNDRYDLGDFRAWVLASPSLPMSTEVDTRRVTPAAPPALVTLPIRLGEPSAPRGTEPGGAR